MFKKIILVATAAALALGTTASAQPYGQDYGYHGGPHGGYYRDRDYDRRDHYDNRDYDRRDHYDNRYDNRYDYRYGGSYGYRGAWRTGDRYPRYNDNRYVVNDYAYYRLPPPRPGYRYYRENNGDIVMVAIASGIIGMIVGNALADQHDGYRH